MNAGRPCPIVLITGASGNLGRSVAKALMGHYQIVGPDREAIEPQQASAGSDEFPVLAVDLSADESVISALQAFRAAYGSRTASVVHLATNAAAQCSTCIDRSLPEPTRPPR